MTETKAFPDDLRSEPTAAAREAPAVLLALVLTAAVGVGAFVVARGAGVQPGRAGVMTLMVATAWLVIAAPAFAAGGGTGISAALRGGVCADASVAALLAVHIGGAGLLTWTVAIQLYLLWLTMALLSAAVVRLGGDRPIRRAALATAVMLAGFVLMGSLLWSGGLLGALDAPQAESAAHWLVGANPLAVVAGLVGRPAGFVWHLQEPVMYQVSRIGQDVPIRPVRWWPMVTALGVAAGLLGAISGGRFTWRRIRWGV